MKTPLLTSLLTVLSAQQVDSMLTALPSPVFVVSGSLTSVWIVMASRLLLLPRRSVRGEALAEAVEAALLSGYSTWVVRRSLRLEASLLKMIRSCSYARV